MSDTNKAITFELYTSEEELRKQLARILANIEKDTEEFFEQICNGNEVSLDKIEKGWSAWIDKYIQIQKQLTESNAKYADSRAQVKKDVESGAITKEEGIEKTAEIDKAQQKDKSTQAMETIKLSENWMTLTKGLRGKSRDEIDALIEDINKQIKEKGLDPIDASALLTETDEIAEANKKKIPDSGFGKWNRGAEDLKRVKQDQKDGKISGVDAEKKIEAATKTRNEGATQSFKEMGAVAAPVNDMLKMFNIKSPAVDGVVGALTSLGEVDFANPMSVITGGLKAVASLMKGIFGENDAAIERDIQRSKEAVKVLKKSYEELDEAIKGAYSYDAATQIASQQANLEDQNQKILDQKALEDSKKTSDKQAIKGYDDAIEANNKQIRELKKSAQNAVFGEDVKSAIDNFASAYMDAWAGGEDKAKSQRDVVKNMIKGVITEMMKSKIAETVQKMRDKIEAALADGEISTIEEDEINTLAKQAADEQDAVNKNLDRFVKDDPDTREATAAKGFGSITQDSADELNGRFTAMQITLLDVHKSQLDMLNLQQLHLPSLQHLSQLTHLSAISDNTAYCRRLEGIQLDMNTVKNELQTINIKGITIRS